MPRAASRDIQLARDHAERTPLTEPSCLQTQELVPSVQDEVDKLSKLVVSRWALALAHTPCLHLLDVRGATQFALLFEHTSPMADENALLPSRIVWLSGCCRCLDPFTVSGC